MANAKENGACRYSLGQEGRELVLTLACKECSGRGPLSDPACLGRALEALAAEDGVDTLIISGHIETQIQLAGMAVLGRLVVLAGDLSQLSMRDPPRDCRDRHRCALRPGELFEALRASLLSDAASFPAVMRDRIARINGLVCTAGPACRECHDATGEDLDLIAQSFDELARYIIKQGFQIVV